MLIGFPAETASLAQVIWQIGPADDLCRQLIAPGPPQAGRESLIPPRSELAVPESTMGTQEWSSVGLNRAKMPLTCFLFDFAEDLEEGWLHAVAIQGMLPAKDRPRRLINGKEVQPLLINPITLKSITRSIKCTRVSVYQKFIT